MTLHLINGPQKEPVSLAEAKAHLRLEDNEEDALVQSLIVAARKYLDGYTGYLGHCLITQTWRLDIPEFPLRGIKLPLTPLQSVESIEYYDTEDVQQTVSTDVYEVVTDEASKGVVHLLGDQSWPVSVDDDRLEPIQITFKAGYGDDWNAVPQPIRHAMLLMIGSMYERREPEIVGASISPATFTVESLLQPYRMIGFG